MHTNQIHPKRFVTGGIVASVVLFLLSGVLNGAILSGDFKSWTGTMGSTITPSSSPMPLWALMSLIQGFSLMLLYVWIRPRFGAGPGPGVIAGVFLWFATKLTVGIDLYAVGLFTPQLLLGQVVGGLVMFILSALAGASVYRES
jgi:hypothetical protein